MRRLFAGLFILCLVSSVIAAPQKRRPRRPAAVFINVPPRITIDEGRIGLAKIVLAVGKVTAVFTPSPVLGVVSSVVGRATASEPCAAPICQEKNSTDSPSNTIYLLANRAGVSSNLWLEMADASLMVNVLTVNTSAPYTAEVTIKTKAAKASLESMRSQIMAMEAQLNVARERQSTAEAAAREAVEVAKNARALGLAEGVEGERRQALAALATLALKRAKSPLVKTKEMTVYPLGTPMRTASGWWTVYRVENRTDATLAFGASSAAGPVVLSDDGTLAAKSKRQLAVFVGTKEGTPKPQISFTSVSSHIAAEVSK